MAAALAWRDGIGQVTERGVILENCRDECLGRRSDAEMWASNYTNQGAPTEIHCDDSQFLLL
jgi:hypothetical protein